MNFKPMNDRVLVQQSEAETVTKGGFIIPDAVAEPVNKGTVVATGPGRITEDGVTVPLTVTVGNKIMYTVGAGQPVKINGEQYLVMKEDEIIAIID